MKVFTIENGTNNIRVHGPQGETVLDRQESLASWPSTLERAENRRTSGGLKPDSGRTRRWFREELWNG